MRVIAGSARGCKLTAVPGLRTRPTADRIKETIFNILMPRLSGAAVLDLFSGTGALSIEALSRGADYAVLVEINRQAAKIAAENLKIAGVAERSRLLTMDATVALKELGKDRESNGRPFDLIFLDPPYGQGLLEPALQGILEYKLLDDTGIIITEQGSGEEIKVPKPLDPYKIKLYKTTKLIFYRINSNLTPGEAV